MKKVLSLILATAMMASMLAGCGSDDSASNSTSSTGSSSSTSSESSSSSSSSESSSSATATESSFDWGSAVVDQYNLDINWDEEPDGVVAGSSVMVISGSDWVTMQMPGQFNGAQSTYQLIYDTLFWSPSGDWTDLTGLLVKDYTVSEEDYSWVLNLHEDVYFMNGRNLNADSVIGTFNYLQDLGGFAFLSGWEATGEHQVTLYVDAPCADIPYRLANGNTSIFDTTAYDELGFVVESAYMAGSGPYYISDYGVGDYITLTANPNCWHEERQAHIETVNIKVITNTTTSFSVFLAGEADFYSLSADNYENCLNNDGIYIYTQQGGSSTVWLNADGLCEYLANDRVREALTMMIDVEQVMLAATAGYGAVGDSCLNTADLITYVHDRPYDPEGGLAILAEEGIDPSDIVMTAICSTNASNSYTNIQSQLMDMGITLDFVATDQNVVMTAGMAGEWDMWTELGGLGILPYYTAQLTNIWGPDAVQEVINDPDIKETVANMVVEFTSVLYIEDSYPIINEICQILDENYAYLCNWNGTTFYGYNDRIVNGVNDGLTGGWLIYKSWIAE